MCKTLNNLQRRPCTYVPTRNTLQVFYRLNTFICHPRNILENIRGRFGIHPELKRNLRLTRPMLYRFQCTTVELYIPILLSHRDSNPNLQNQNLSCYHYTMRQFDCGERGIRTPLLQDQYDNLCSDVIYSHAPLSPQILKIALKIP